MARHWSTLMSNHKPSSSVETTSATGRHFTNCGCLPVFHQPPRFDLLRQLFWSPDFRFTRATWPFGVNFLLHEWDGGVYRQMFSAHAADLQVLIDAHRNDTRLEMYQVDLDREYPKPSNQQLQKVQ